MDILQYLRASSTQDMGALCFSMGRVNVHESHMPDAGHRQAFREKPFSRHCIALYLRASSTQDMGALCFSMAKVGSTDSMALGTGSLSSTKLLTAPGGRLRSCTGNVRSMSCIRLAGASGFLLDHGYFRAAWPGPLGHCQAQSSSLCPAEHSGAAQTRRLPEACAAITGALIIYTLQEDNHRMYHSMAASAML